MAHQSPASEPLSLPFIPWLTLHSPLGVLRTPSWAGQLLRGSRGTGRGREGLPSSSCSVPLSSLNHLERMRACPWACLPVQDGHPEKDQLASQRATRGHITPLPPGAGWSGCREPLWQHPGTYTSRPMFPPSLLILEPSWISGSLSGLFTSVFYTCGRSRGHHANHTQ